MIAVVTDVRLRSARRLRDRVVVRPSIEIDTRLIEAPVHSRAASRPTCSSPATRRWRNSVHKGEGEDVVVVDGRSRYLHTATGLISSSSVPFYNI
jgi:hypothetical protein